MPGRRTLDSMVGSEEETTGHDADTQSGTFAGRHPYLVYTTLRLGLLVVAGGLSYLLGARGILLILLAFVISGLASFVLLVPQRDRVGQSMGSYFRRLDAKIEESKRSEDDIVDEYRASQAATSAESEPARPAESSGDVVLPAEYAARADTDRQ